MKRWGALILAICFLVIYNGAQPDLRRFRTMNISPTMNPDIEAKTDEQKKLKRKLSLERYGPSLEWLDRVLKASGGQIGEDDPYTPRLDARVLSSLMVAGLASGFKSQVANLIWMKSDEYWHKGLATRQNPLMEMVVTLDPQFVEAWDTAGWHWAYNIYADIPLNERYKGQEKLIRQKQEKAIETGLDYLKRGANMNPDTYLLWFKWGWTRAEKAGYYDDETVALYRIARTKPDAREIEVSELGKDGKPVMVKKEGKLDVVGNTIAHIYEKSPDIEKALDMWGRDLLKGKPEELAMLRAVGEYWRRYGSDYAVIAQMYQEGDAVMKNRIKALVPDVERLVAAHKMREKLQVRAGTPTGAYITIATRYLPAWQLKKQGKLKEAEKLLIGVMNADQRVHLTHLPVLGRVLELRGDATEAIQKQFKALRDIEKTSAQDIGLHFLAVLYEEMAKQAKDPKQQQAYQYLAYETWYRARERDQLNFYALAKTRRFEDRFDFATPQHIVAAVKKSRRGGNVEAAPTSLPSLEKAYQLSQTRRPAGAPPAEAEKGHEGHDHGEHEGHDHGAPTGKA